MSSRRGCSSSVGTSDAIDGRRLRKCRRDAAAAAAVASSATNKSLCLRLKTDSTNTTPRQYLFPMRREDGVSERCGSSSSSFLKRTCRVTDRSETLLLKCSEPNCEKKYRRMSGLRYHQSHAHDRRPSTAGRTTDAAFSCDARKKIELGRNPFVELSKSLFPEVEAGKYSEGLTTTATTSGMPIFDVTDAGNEKSTVSSRKRQAAVGRDFCKKMRTGVVIDVDDHEPSFSRSSEEDVVDATASSGELSCKTVVESHENCSNVVTDGVAKDQSQNAVEQFSVLDSKMSCLNVNSNPNSPKKYSGSPLGNDSKDHRVDESFSVLLKHPSDGALIRGDTTSFPNDVSYDSAMQKLSVVDSQQKYGTATSAALDAKSKSRLKDAAPLSDQSTDDKMMSSMKENSEPLIGYSACSKGNCCNGNLNDDFCSYTAKPKKVAEVCDSKTSQNIGASDNHCPHEYTDDSKQPRICNELCANATFDCNITEKPQNTMISSECFLSVDTPDAFDGVFQHPSSGFAACDQVAEKLVRKHVKSMVRNAMHGDDASHLVKEIQCNSVISPRNGIHKKQEFDEGRYGPIVISSSQLSSDKSQSLLDLMEASDLVNAPKGLSSADSALRSDDTFREPGSRAEEAEEAKECFRRRIESDVVSLVDSRTQTLSRKTCYSIQQCSENITQVSVEVSVPTIHKEVVILDELNVPLNDFDKHSNSRLLLGLDTSQSNSPAVLSSEMPPKKAASDQDLPLDEQLGTSNSQKHAPCIKRSSDEILCHHPSTEQSKQVWADDPHSRLSLPESCIKPIDVHDSKPAFEAIKSDPELCRKRPQDISTTPSEPDIAASKVNPHSSRTVDEKYSFSSTGRQKLETKSTNECWTRSQKGVDAHRVQNDLDLSQVKGVSSQNPSRRSEPRNRIISSAGDRHLHSHAVTKSSFNTVYGHYAGKYVNPRHFVKNIGAGTIFFFFLFSNHHSTFHDKKCPRYAKCIKTIC